jgi:hypothetical protein
LGEDWSGLSAQLNRASQRDRSAEGQLIKKVPSCHQLAN